MTDPRDVALQHSCPALSAPRFGALPDMENGQRVIVAANGVFVHVKLDCIVRIADLAPVPALPFGALRERVAFSFGVIPVTLLERFVEAGRCGLPNEVAGGLIYSRRTKGLRLAVFDAIRACPDRIDYRMPDLASDETVAVDLHTHGRDAAFWSPTDNRDDRGIKVAGVFGHLHQAKPSAAFRLAVNGHYVPLRHPWDSGIERAATSQCRLEARGCRSKLKWLGMQRGGE